MGTSRVFRNFVFRMMRPVDVIQPQMNDIAPSKPKPREQKENRPVPQSNGPRKVRRTDDLFHFTWSQVGGQ
jgi:hypothetical protein